MNDSLLPSRALRVFSALASALWWLLVAFWVVLALAWGALHGWIVPRIGELTPRLEMQATRALGVPVRIGSVSARSDGLMPTLELRDVVLHDAQAREALRLARVVAAVSPRSLWNLGFEQLVIESPELEVRRMPDGRFQVAGLELSGERGEDDRAADWFFRQKEVLVLGGLLRFVDETRPASPALALSDIRFVSRNSARRHSMRLDATPPPEWGSRFQVSGVFRQPLWSVHPGRWSDWTGQLHADVASLDLSRLRDHTGWGASLRDARGALRAWIDIEQGRAVGGAADVDLRQVRARFAPDRPVLALDALSGRVDGHWTARGFDLQTRRLRFQLQGGPRWPGGDVSLNWQQALGRQPAHGSVGADRLDIGAVAQLARHLPVDARWQTLLARHAPSGAVESLQARWQLAAGGPRYSASGRATQLALAAGGGVPGVRGADVEFDASDTGGKARVRVQGGAVDLAGILQEPLVPIEQLATDLQWRIAGGRLNVEARGMELRNADLRAHGQASWRSAEARRPDQPGLLDLDIAITQADGARVVRYLPLSIGQGTLDYVRASVQGGRISDGRIRVRGDLHHFPFADPRQGEFRISAKVRDLTYAFAPPAVAPSAEGQWPTLAQLSGELLFERNGMFVRGAQGRFAGFPGLLVQADASIPDFSSSTVNVTGLVRGPLAESVAVFNAMPVAAWVGQPLAQASVDGPADVRLRLALPLAHLADSKVQGSVVLSGNELRLRPDVPALSRTRGTVAFHEGGFSIAGAQARALGGEVRIDGGTRAAASAAEAPVQLRLQGTASAEGLAGSAELGAVTRLARRASGSAAYTALIDIRDSGVDLGIDSNLQGLALDLPAPLAKAAEAALPVHVGVRALPGAPSTDRVSVRLGQLVLAVFERDVSGPQARVLRGAIGVGLGAGESAPLPARGVLANVRLDSVNLDAWQEALSGLAPAAGPASREASAGGAAGSDYLPTILAVRARELKMQGRTLDQVVVGGSREGPVWRANVDADQLGGYVEYRQPSDGNPGRVLARLARLSIAASHTDEVESLLDQQPSSIPALDVVVDDFELRGRRLGRLEIEATNRGTTTAAGAPEWRLNKLRLSMPEAVFSASGNWAPARAGARERRRTAMNFKLDISDSGALLSRLGMHDVIRRGRGQLEGEVAWMGSPLALDYPSLTGEVDVGIQAGQFLKAEPGPAKLLGVLSLQSLPRRLSLDFRDVFSDGFAFDFVRGHMKIEQGVASTNNLQMKGVNAAVLMDGSADLARETQDLRVIVVPEINAGTASLVATVINPAIGLGTFLAQMFLREPLMRAATQEFHVDGTWSDPRVTRVRRQESRLARDANARAAMAQGS
ncbi:TIGR02099 family protein [Ramlibacter sp. AW1]|uniref:TIGR02099 family protein n=1 Tax=Ramlibacter aurantiacus TaxID=2801330 RepID=A0A937D7Q3_9BURK|nr:YhdP family protein [Ramlibacter aurantiacus]MBL0421191.1 TIGR02099 family protein [Ramlibacter aurantiacus]